MELPMNIEIKAGSYYRVILDDLVAYSTGHQNEFTEVRDEVEDWGWLTISENFDKYEMMQRVNLFVYKYFLDMYYDVRVRFVISSQYGQHLQIDEDPEILIKWVSYDDLYMTSWHPSETAVSLFHKLNDAEKLYLKLI